jgi:hypothetical protein
VREGRFLPGRCVPRPYVHTTMEPVYAVLDMHVLYITCNLHSHAYRERPPANDIDQPLQHVLVIVNVLLRCDKGQQNSHTKEACGVCWCCAASRTCSCSRPEERAPFSCHALLLMVTQPRCVSTSYDALSGCLNF